MNSRLRAHLWLEWREHRAAVLGLVAAAVLGSVVMAWLGVRAKLPMIDAPAFALCAAAALAILSLGSEVLGRELSGDARSAIARLPGSLATPFSVRLIGFTLVVAVSGLAAWAAMRTAVGWFSPRPIADAPLLRYPILLLLLGIGATWTLAASCWLKKSALAAPAAAALLCALIVVPLTLRVHDRPVFFRIDDALGPIAALAVLAGVIAAWVSFARGLRHGGGRVAAFVGGAASLVLFTVPIPAFAGYRTYDWLHLDPDDPEFRVSNCFVGEDGRYAFVNGSRDGSTQDRNDRATYAYVVDLATGDHEALGVDRWFESIAKNLGAPTDLPAPPGSRPQPFVRCFLFDLENTSVVFDGRTGKVIGDDDALRANPETNARLAAIVPDPMENAKWSALEWMSARAEDRFLAFEDEDHALVLEGGEAKAAKERAADHPVVRISRIAKERTPIRDRNGEPIAARGLRGSANHAGVARSADGSVLLQLQAAGDRSFVVSVAPGSEIASTIVDGMMLEAVIDSGAILATAADRRRLARVALDGGEPEIVFPATRE